MQKTLLLAGLLLLASCTPQTTNDEILDTEIQDKLEGNHLVNASVASTLPLRSRSKQDILDYFDTLVMNKQVIVGQHCGNGPDDIWQYYNTYIDMLTDVTGRNVGLMGADLGIHPSINYPIQTLIDHWNEGGLVTLSWHADNPFEPGYDVYASTVESADQIDLRSLLKGEAATVAWNSYRKELDNMAGSLQKLRDAGVIVIWRPFHEMNGDYFWWGMDAYNGLQTNEADFVALWKDLYNTLTYDYGLDNLIWTYSVIPHKNWNANVTAYYPGSDHVDLVGMDFYGAHPNFPDYEALKTLGKTIVMSEVGPTESAYGLWNEIALVNAMKGKAAYFLQWHSWPGGKVAIKDNLKVIEMMNSETVITLDELFEFFDQPDK